MSNPLLDRAAKRDSGHHGRKAERSLAQRMGGTLQPGSGALDGAKADVKKDTQAYSILMESKATKGASITLQKDWLAKVYQEALEANRVPALAFAFTSDSGASAKKDRWVAVPEHIFQQLIGD